jgi:hypothetical protein
VRGLSKGRRVYELITTEDIMGFFSRSTSTEPYSTLGSSDTLPANVPPGGSLRDRLSQGGTVLADRATQIYKQNPKLVGGLAVLAGAAILAGMKKRGR